MKLGSKYAFLIKFINTMFMDKDNQYTLVMPELAGDVKLDVGNNKNKKYMYIKGNIAFPYDLITEDAKDIDNIPNVTHYAYMKKNQLSDMALRFIDDSEEDISKFFKVNPEVKSALDNLVTVLEKAKY